MATSAGLGRSPLPQGSGSRPRTTFAKLQPASRPPLGSPRLAAAISAQPPSRLPFPPFQYPSSPCAAPPESRLLGRALSEPFGHFRKVRVQVRLFPCPSPYPKPFGSDGIGRTRNSPVSSSGLTRLGGSSAARLRSGSLGGARGHSETFGQDRRRPRRFG